VEDKATAALTRLFFHRLLVDRKNTSDALREAQQYLFHHPSEIELLLDLNHEIRFDRPREKTKTPTKYWAAFMLSIGPE
jgi:CHAT domain-containing protein